MLSFGSRTLTISLVRPVLPSLLRKHHNACNDEVRVRFAPSPTGGMHLGGLRTALYNYIFARKYKGKFILRIEDTDLARKVPGSAKEIEDLLNWASLKPDESPTIGGPSGPYSQSARLKLYHGEVERLLAERKAYRCFCSHTRLDLLKKSQLRNREKPRYDGKCKHLSSNEVEAKLDENDGKHVVRFSLQPGVVAFEDMIFDKISIDLVSSIEGDPIILKSDGYPTYHFANVVDDHHMRISHVLRGSEWLPSTAKHVQIYNAFGWRVPRFAHFPLITMQNGSKMSKRNNESQLTHYINLGYHPLALVNFLTNMGGGLPKLKQDLNQVWTLEQIVDEFDFDKVIRHPGSADMNRLNIFNTYLLTKLWNEDKSEVLRLFQELLSSRGISTDLDESQLITILGHFIGTRIVTLNNLLIEENSYLWKCPTFSWEKKPYNDEGWDLSSLVKNLIDLVNTRDIDDKAGMLADMKDLAKTSNIKWPALMMFTRKLLTNNKDGQPIVEIFQVLGKTRLLQYLHIGLKYVNEDEKTKS